VVEVVENDWQGRCPMLSLRFYRNPTYTHQTAAESAEKGRPLYDEDTPMGIEINLGPEIARSFIEQIQAKWLDYPGVVTES
jgi:hypothetical protein